MYSGFFFVSDLIFLAAQHTQCCLHISTCFQSMMWILSLMRSVVASLHHPKLHTCQQEATGAKKKELLLFFSWIPRMVVHPTTIIIHVWEDRIMTRLLSLWSHTRRLSVPLRFLSVLDLTRRLTLVNHGVLWTAQWSLYFLSPLSITLPD